MSTLVLTRTELYSEEKSNLWLQSVSFAIKTSSSKDDDDELGLNDKFFNHFILVAERLAQSSLAFVADDNEYKKCSKERGNLPSGPRKCTMNAGALFCSMLNCSRCAVVVEAVVGRDRVILSS